VAVALLDGQVLPPQFTSTVDADDVWTLIERVDVRHESGIGHRPSAGAVHHRAVHHPQRRHPAAIAGSPKPHGGPADPVSNAEIVAKFRHLTTAVPDTGAPRRGAERRTRPGPRRRPRPPSFDLLAPPVHGVLD